MIFKNKIRVAIAVAFVGMVGASLQATALPNVSAKSGHGALPAGLLRTTAAACQPATSAIDLDINNVRARLMTGGDMWWNIGISKAAYEVPKGGGASSLFAGSCWIGGYDQQGQLKVAAQTYRQDGNDYWPGALDATAATISSSECSSWDRFWKVNKSDVIQFISLKKTGGSTSGSQFDAINQWPAKGNTAAMDANGIPLILPIGRDYAPFVDANNNGIYDPQNGDYPDIDGDQYIWWVFNDAGNVKGQTQTASIGLEVQASAFAYSTNDALNDATFYNYRVINRGSFTLDSTYIATWSDADLGWAYDDYIGCDTIRGLGILYNGTSFDGTGGPGTYGSHIPMVGVDFFKGPKKQIPDYQHPGKMKDTTLKMTVFDYYNNDFTDIGNPTNGLEIYNYMTGSLRKGERFSDDWNGVAGNHSVGYGKGPISKFVFYGDPEPTSNTWSECVCSNLPWDRRFIHSSGPFTLKAGDFEDITIGAVWVPDVGGCPNASFKPLRAADDQAQALFDANFKALQGPDAPKLTYRELDRKVIFYLDNDPISNNYKEQYGRSDSSKFRETVIKAKNLGYSDSLYQFEGYRVFQLANSGVNPAQIFNSAGEVDPTVAKEVFECDISNGVKSIINYTRSDVSDTTWVPQRKILTAKDSGIVHSFIITQDQFATGNDKTLVNYKTYYYVAIAYAYNNFAPFNSRKVDSTQELPYLGSTHAAGGVPLTVDTVIPNPANGNMGNVLNSDYGSGVIITRITGTGNGGNVLQLNQQSVDAAMSSDSGYIAKNATYDAGQGPVNIRVIDPVAIKPADWELFVQGPANTNASKGIIADSGSWMLIARPADGSLSDTVYSENSMTMFNDRLLTKYGLSISIQQVTRPGDDQTNGNGYITSSITFADSSKPWLAGVQDQGGTDPRNWLRTGVPNDTGTPCNFLGNKFDSTQAYQNLLSNNSATASSWAPYSLAGALEYHGTINGVPVTNGSPCGFAVAAPNTQPSIDSLFSVDIVFTSDKSKWTRCVVLEEQEDPNLSEGKVAKFKMRRHQGWNGDADASGVPIYSTNSNDSGFSWFPGYAINQETGERVNIVFGEDSWLKTENGADMIWNPTSNVLNLATGDVIFGGKHYVYISNTRYDKDSAFATALRGNSAFVQGQYFKSFQWVGVPLLNVGSSYLPLNQGIIPTTATIRIRVKRPYAYYWPSDPNYIHNVVPNSPVIVPDPISHKNILDWPHYIFSTKGLVPTPVSDVADKDTILDKIQVVPNPYYAYAGYESNRLDTRVRITNLPAKATVNIYALDGTLVRSLSKSDPNVSYIDWDIRNTIGLQVTSGMYLMDVQAEGIGEKVLRWFGAMRPLDITTY